MSILLSLSFFFFFFSNLQPLSPLSRKQAAWQVSKPPGWSEAPPHASPSPHPSRGSQSRVQKTHPSALVQTYTLREDTEVLTALRHRHLL